MKRLADGKVEKAVKRSVKVASQDNQKERQRAKKQQELLAQRQQKREQKKRGAAPRLVVLVAFSGRASAAQAKMALVNSCVALLDGPGPVTVAPESDKRQKMTFLAVEAGSVFDVLEAALVADVLVPVVDAAEGVGPEGMRLASAIKAQGLPAVQPLLTGMARLPERDRHAAKKGLLADLQFLFPNVTRVLPMDEAQGDVGQVFRFLAQTRLCDLHFRAARSFVLAEQLEFEPDAVAAGPRGDSVVEAEPMGTLRVTGYVRGGRGLSADMLVHVPGLGDMQLERITDAADGALLHTATDARPSLQSENDADPFGGGGEQTWPTEQDVAMAEASGDESGEGGGGTTAAEAARGRRRRRRVPAGMSEYQAAWLPDSGDEMDDDEEDEGGEGDGEAMEEGMDESSGGADEVQDDPEGEAGLDLMEQDEERREKERDERLWPDEVEAPADAPARERFQKYRGLDSFRSSVWDPKENLPLDYSRIFQLERFAHFVRRQARAAEEAPVAPGRRVTLHARCSARAGRMAAAEPRPVVVGSLLRHEQRVSVLHFDVLKSAECREPVASGEELVAFFGLRRLLVTPLFSQHVSGCDKCKYERFLPAAGACMASFYGPITHAPCTVTLWRLAPAQLPVLVASGTLRAANADLLIIKKIILTAHPARVHKRTALCRGMFHFPEDVRWFKPVALWTKEGRVGHIRESNGTKGDFKAVFDGQLANSDVICMSLYKRVFPKWQFENCFAKN